MHERFDLKSFTALHRHNFMSFTPPGYNSDHNEPLL